MDPISGALCSAWHLGSPVSSGGSHADAQVLQTVRESKVSPCSLTSSQESNSCPTVGDRRVGVQATREVCGKQGEETAVTSKAATQSSSHWVSFLSPPMVPSYPNLDSMLLLVP